MLSPNKIFIMKRITILFILLIPSSFLFSQNLQLTWQQCYGGSESDAAFDIIEIQDGYLIIGNTESDDGDIYLNHGAEDGWLIKTDTHGLLIWEKSFGGTKGDGFRKILKCHDNNYYLIGGSNSSDGDISFDPYPNTLDYWIVKIDSIGSIIWEMITGGNGHDQIWTGTLTDDGGVLAFGWTGSSDGDVSDYYGLYDMWMVKIDSSGDKEWDFTIGTSGMDVGQAIIQTSDGGYLVGGSSRMNEGGNLICEPYSFEAEAILVKLDSNRNIEWQQCYGGSGDEGITGLREIEQGYIFVAYTESNDGDVSGFHGLPYEGMVDIWVVKVDNWGNIIWQKCLGGSRSEFVSEIIITEDENIIIPGITQSNDGDVLGNHTLSEHDFDIWVVKLSDEGDLLWQQCIGGLGNEKLDYGIIKKSDNNFVISGQTDYGPSFDVECTPHPGVINYPDFWVFEIQDTTSVGLNEILNKNAEFLVYPNPAKDYVVFERKEYPTTGKIQIVNVFGEEIETLFVKPEKTVWDTRQIKSGIYFYKMELDGKFVSGRILIIN